MARICMVAYTYYINDSRVRREAEALSDLGHDVIAIGLQWPFEMGRRSRNGVEIVRLPIRKWRGTALGYFLSYAVFFILASLYVSSLSLRQKIDIVHIHNMPDLLVFVGAIPKLMGAHLILDVHDPMPEIFSSMPKARWSSFFKALLLFQERMSHRFADTIITVHDGMRDLLISRGQDPSLIDVVMNLPDLQMFSPREKRGLPRNGFELVYSGTVSPRHALDVVLEAMSILREEMLDMRLVVLGEGPDLNRLIGLAKRMALGNRVAFRGAVSLDTVPELLLNADAGISSVRKSPFGELQFPVKVLEYMSVGLPVLCARTPTVERYIPESAIYYFDSCDPASLAEQIRLVRSNEKLLAEKSVNSRRFIRSMNWNQERGKLLRIYEKIFTKQRVEHTGRSH